MIVNDDFLLWREFYDQIFINMRLVAWFVIDMRKKFGECVPSTRTVTKPKQKKTSNKRFRVHNFTFN